MGEEVLAEHGDLGARRAVGELLKSVTDETFDWAANDEMSIVALLGACREELKPSSFDRMRQSSNSRRSSWRWNTDVSFICSVSFFLHLWL